MKRTALLLIPLILTLASCRNEPVTPTPEPAPEGDIIPNQEVVEELKEILNKQDLSELYTKSFRGMYSQEYDVLEISSDDEEATKTSSYLNYGGYGVFGYYYDLSLDEYDSIVDEKGNIDTFDAIATGRGSYGITHLTRTMSFNREGSAEAKIYNLDIQQNTTLKTTDEDVWVDNTLYISDDGIFHYESRQELSASINKELLFGSVSTRTFRNIFSKVDLFDAPGNIEHLDKLYYSICRELVSKNDKEISDFILGSQISIESDEENIKVNFVFDTENIDEDEFDYIYPGAIEGTLLFDKETYKFTEFSYEMNYKSETNDEETGSSKFIDTKFTCSGESTRELPHDSWEPINPTLYDDVSKFLEDVNEQVVPPEIYL